MMLPPPELISPGSPEPDAAPHPDQHHDHVALEVALAPPRHGPGGVEDDVETPGPALDLVEAGRHRLVVEDVGAHEHRRDRYVGHSLGQSCCAVLVEVGDHD